tara:strand:+ start:453 stop:878 length:426 start_codon:yes stop_codon:yes gene_type:complete
MSFSNILISIEEIIMNELIIKGYRKVVSKKNKMKFSRKHGRAYKTKEVKDFEDYVSTITSEAIYEWQVENCTEWNMKKQYHLNLSVIFGDKRKRDIQNCFDCICDSLEGFAYENDAQIISVSGDKIYDKNTWTFEITITEI